MIKRSVNNRREFLKKGIQSAAVAAACPSLFNDNFNSPEPGGEKQKLLYRTLGNTGIKLPVISMGTGDTNNPKLIKAAIDSGVRLLATSQYYGNGNNERIVGEVIKEYDTGKMIVMTSAMPDGFNHKEGLFTDQADPEKFIKKVGESLDRLGLEQIDIFLLPFAARKESVFYEPMLRAMEKIKQDGKAKYIGVATHKFEHEAVRAAADTGIYDVVMTAYNFRRKNIPELNESIDYAAAKGLGIIGMKSMAGAHWDKEKTIPLNTKAALKWVLQNENIHTTVPGFTNYEELQQDISIMSDPELTDEEKSDLKLALGNSRHGIYCEQCGVCTGQCKEALDIPTLMRSYMYAYGYGNFQHAKSTLRHADLKNYPCSGCETCRINCTAGFDIKDKITDIIRIKDIPEEFLA